MLYLEVPMASAMECLGYMALGRTIPAIKALRSRPAQLVCTKNDDSVSMPFLLGLKDAKDMVHALEKRMLDGAFPTPDSRRIKITGLDRDRVQIQVELKLHFLV